MLPFTEGAKLYPLAYSKFVEPKCFLHVHTTSTLKPFFPQRGDARVEALANAFDRDPICVSGKTMLGGLMAIVTVVPGETRMKVVNTAVTIERPTPPKLNLALLKAAAAHNNW